MLRIHSLVVLFGLVYAFAVGACSSSGPANTVDSFYRAVESGEVTAASEMVSGMMIGPKKIRAELQNLTAAIARKKGIQSIEILSEEVDGPTANIRVRITCGNGEMLEQNVTLTRIDGRWMINHPKGK